MFGDVLAHHLSLIGELSPSDRDALREIRGQVRDVRRGEDILRVGDRPTEAVMVLSGLLQRYGNTISGETQVFALYLPTEAPSLETLHIDYMDNSLCAVCDSRVAILPHPELFRVMEERPKVLALIWRQTLVQGAIFREWMKRNSQMVAPAAMAHLFCEMIFRARSAGLIEDYSIDLPITQQLLGAALGQSLVHVNRTLMVLRASGSVEFKAGRLTVRDWDRLVEIAEFDPSYLHLRSNRTPDGAVQ